MNSVFLIGRLTKDIELKYTASQLAVATFNVAIGRGKDKNGEDRGTDYPRVVVYGRQAENCEKYLAKGRLVAVRGHIQTSSYKASDGKTTYYTDVIADMVEFIDWGEKNGTGRSDSLTEGNARDTTGFEQISYDDVPF